MRPALILLAAFAISLPASAGDMLVEYDVDFKLFRGSVSDGDPLTFELFRDRSCTDLVASQVVTAGDPALQLAKLITQKVAGGVKGPRTMRLRTVVLAASFAGPRYLRVTGAGVTGVPGDCQVQADRPLPTSVYSASFEEGVTPTGQCNEFAAFRAGLTAPSYEAISLDGSLGSESTCTDPAAATTLLTALRNGSTASAVCDGVTWRVGVCGSGAEIGAGTSSVCNCEDPGTALRPCIGNDNFGGVGTETCGGPSQSMTLIVD